jgi:hypothetical protein
VLGRSGGAFLGGDLGHGRGQDRPLDPEVEPAGIAFSQDRLARSGIEVDAPRREDRDQCLDLGGGAVLARTASITGLFCGIRGSTSRVTCP